MDVPESVLPESVAVIADGVHLELSCAIRAGEPCVVLRAYSGAEHKSFSLAPVSRRGVRRPEPRAGRR